MALPVELAVALKVARALDALGLRYLIGGSLASSLHGVPRSSHDADLLAEIPGARADEIAAHLAAEFYVDADMIRDAVRRAASFNVIDNETGFKVDVFVLTRDPLLQEEMARREHHVLDAAPGAGAWFASAEDIVLQKLDWFRKGGEVSERQWNDVLGVIKVQRDLLDAAYLRKWAAVLGITGLLECALGDGNRPA